jgi:hypothetical protein
MAQKIDLVDSQIGKTGNYGRGFRWFLKTGLVMYPGADNQEEGPYGELKRDPPCGVALRLLDPEDDYGDSHNMFATGIYDAKSHCDEWAARVHWMNAHVCPLRKEISTEPQTFVGSTSTEYFLPCIGLGCALWDWYETGEIPCLQARVK